MKIKLFQIYRDGEYGRGGTFNFWSGPVRSEGDKNLSPSSPKSPSRRWKTWRKVIILAPIGDSATSFSMGFKDIFGRTKISTAKRKVGDGLFGMRVGPEACDFFIVSNDGGVELRFVGYVDIHDPAQAETPLY